MRITTAQIRAARALLDWSQGDLAERSNVSVTSIGNIEKGATTPREETLQVLQHTFEDAGVEFLENEGVSWKRSDVIRYEGISGLRNLMDDVYDYACSGDSDVILMNANPENWNKWLGPEWLGMHLDRMAKIKTGMTYRIITKRGTKNLISSSFAEYRYVPEELFNDRSIYCYGDKLAFVNFEPTKVAIFVVNQKHFSSSIRVLFDIAWTKVAQKVGVAA